MPNDDIKYETDHNNQRSENLNLTNAGQNEVAVGIIMNNNGILQLDGGANAANMINIINHQHPLQQNIGNVDGKILYNLPIQQIQPNGMQFLGHNHHATDDENNGQGFNE